MMPACLPKDSRSGDGLFSPSKPRVNATETWTNPTRGPAQREVSTLHRPGTGSEVMNRAPTYLPSYRTTRT